VEDQPIQNKQGVASSEQPEPILEKDGQAASQTAPPVSDQKAALSTPQKLTPQPVRFPHGLQAQLVVAPEGVEAREIVSALGVNRPNLLFSIVGDANDQAVDYLSQPLISSKAENETVQVIPASADQPLPVLEDKNFTRGAYLAQLFSRGIARTALSTGAAIIDGGRQRGAMAMMGQGVAERGRRTPLIGVAPAGKVTYPGGPANLKDGEPLDPNHTHFVLTEGDQWGDETETMIQLAAALAEPEPGGAPDGKDKLVVTILINGGSVAKKQVLQVVQRGWPVIVIQGSGHLADEIAALWQSRPDFIPDPALAEIISEGKLYFLPLSGSIERFGWQIEQLLRYHRPGITSIEQAWQTFADYDAAANRQQQTFRRLQFWILALGVVATFLAITEASMENWVNTEVGFYYLFDRSLYYIILIIPIVITALAAVANEFSAGKKWILLRASAESIKKEIYRYRAKAEIYSDQQTRNISREQKLVQRINTISDNLTKGETKLTAIESYKGSIPPPGGAHPSDDGLSLLTPDRYLPLRLQDQYNFYKSRTIRLEKQLQRLQWMIYIIGGAGTLLVAIGLELWIALTTALVTAFTTFLEYQQVESRLIRYNRTAINLHQIMMWWEALSVEEQADPRNVDKLVASTEGAIYSEHAAWVQEMQDVFDELNARQAQDSQRSKSSKIERVTPEESIDFFKPFEGEVAAEEAGAAVATHK